ncbi:thiol-disulfide oxidoreductase DCC family protein [Vibrio fluminensis]|uniref:thiol-disulfide oxidoreductase DCC family protein n=1 Tax=Vibrio fluminensis TaxID=2783614 RepID=UPI001E34C976|nr:DUF393 domain-containing protein [Vibrio fluminensis]
MNNIAVFYDASCPLCVREMTALSKHLTKRITFVNVLDSDLMSSYPEISIAESKRVLHVLDENGTLRLGVDANVYLWELTGTKRYLTLLRLPIIRNVANVGYWLFARNRYRLSRLLTGKSKCEQCEL